MTSSSSASVNTSTMKNIYADFNVYKNGDIRYVGKRDWTYTVLELHRFLSNLSDRIEADEKHQLDIFRETPSDRLTDQMIRLNGDYNIDDEVSKYLYDGTIIQGEDNKEEVYSGMVVIGSVNSPDTKIGFIQQINREPICTRYLTAGFNGDTNRQLILRCLLKTKTNGEWIDDGNVIIRARHVRDTSAEYKLIIGNYGQHVIPIFTQEDLYYDEIIQNGVSMDRESPFNGTNYPVGSPLLPVNNLKDARKIAERYDITPPVEEFITLDDALI